MENPFLKLASMKSENAENFRRQKNKFCQSHIYLQKAL